MKDKEKSGATAARSTLDMPADEFRRVGHALVDDIAAFYDSLRERPLTRSASPAEIRSLLGADELPEEGVEVAQEEGEEEMHRRQQVGMLQLLLSRSRLPLACCAGRRHTWRSVPHRVPA